MFDYGGDTGKAKFFHEIALMSMHSIYGYAELRCNLLIPVALRNQTQYLSFL